ncbi:5 -AMP-activated kinase subunit beta [Hyphodiscus hymeniophilus]|uniref:5 -AMP-activated kinase subunit beta n=1 Tax=Hyphodiscus hymeniophilus TaxID=353542 RepID=A0A9P6VPB8_9HELO|nr:5 -AMP-activated kinase subunit beta [Hyphodiscus hymeniophilus]
MLTHLAFREHPAQEVYVTGTFDDWSKSEKLEKVGDIFVKDVTLSSAAEKIYYKFVVDGNWVTDHTAPQENDASGNLNNVLTTERIKKHTPATAGIMSTVTSSATTAGLAKDVPLENSTLEHTGTSDLPGSFPETPAATEKGDFSVNPLPAFDGAVNPVKLAPGEKVPDPSTLTNHTVTSSVKDDPELVAADKARDESEPTFGVAPLPAFAGAVNPAKVAPGEKIPEPSTVTGNTIESNVTTDKESYENSGGFGNAPVLPPVVTPQNERDAKGTGILDLPPISKNIIPESSLPMGAAGAGAYDASPMIQSSGAGSTTAELAGAVPLESTKVPEVVKESQAEAGVGPEASSVPEEVKEKSAVEKELLGEVKEVPSTSEGTGGKPTADKSEKSVTAGQAATAVGGATVAVGGAAAAYLSGAASNASSTLPASVTSKLPESVQNSIASMNATSASQPVAKDTPDVVKESIAESGQAPEAAANEEAVLEKKAVEKELLSEIKPETATGESAPKTGGLVAKDTPDVVKESFAESGQAPEAAANEEAVLEKKAVEKELLSEIKPETATGESAPKTGGLVAPKSPEPDSRDVSPGTVPGSHTQNQTVPTITSGVASGTTAPVTPAKGAPATPAKSTSGSSKVDSPATTDKKNKRRSFFGKLKDKLSSKDK